jgi:hypothetical protein
MEWGLVSRHTLPGGVAEDIVTEQLALGALTKSINLIAIGGAERGPGLDPAVSIGGLPN